jgi:poly(A) polymerase Pap1
MDMIFCRQAVEAASVRPIQPACLELFEPSDVFISYPNYLSIHIVGQTQADAQAWAGFIESRLRKLVLDMLGWSLPQWYNTH